MQNPLSLTEKHLSLTKQEKVLVPKLTRWGDTKLNKTLTETNFQELEIEGLQ